eukprot:Gb_16654 [translate_table: standard]
MTVTHFSTQHHDLRFLFLFKQGLRSADLRRRFIYHSESPTIITGRLSPDCNLLPQPLHTMAAMFIKFLRPLMILTALLQHGRLPLVHTQPALCNNSSEFINIFKTQLFPQSQIKSPSHYFSGNHCHGFQNKSANTVPIIHNRVSLCKLRHKFNSQFWSYKTSMEVLHLSQTYYNPLQCQAYT